MKKIIKNVILYWKTAELELMDFEENDKIEWKKLFNSYISLSKWLKGYWARWPNMPEWLSESAFCMISWSKRFINWKGADNSFSFDTFNLEENKAEQIKATTIEEDVTSFWPKTKWDNIYFMDFYNNWTVDWTFDVYKIDFNLVKSTILNKKKNETFTDQQIAWKRPRICIKTKIIIPNNIQPIYKSIKFWTAP